MMRRNSRNEEAKNSPFTQKHHLQPALSANVPPITGPIVAAENHTLPTSVSIRLLVLITKISDTMIFTSTVIPPAPMP